MSSSHNEFVLIVSWVPSIKTGSYFCRLIKLGLPIEQNGKWNASFMVVEDLKWKWRNKVAETDDIAKWRYSDARLRKWALNLNHEKRICPQVIQNWFKMGTELNRSFTTRWKKYSQQISSTWLLNWKMIVFNSF